MNRLNKLFYFSFSQPIVLIGGEILYCTPQWEAHCKDSGMEHEYSSRYRHEQNGVVERAMQGIGVPFRCMMIQGYAPERFIPDALRQSNVIRNNSPTKANKGWTPREKEFNSIQFMLATL